MKLNIRRYGTKPLSIAIGLLLLTFSSALYAQSRVGEGAGTGAAVGGVLGLLVTGDLWGAAEGAAMGAAAGAAGGAVADHNAKRRKEREELERHRAREMAMLEQQRLLEEAQRKRADEAQRAQVEAERQHAEQEQARVRQEYQRLEKERLALAAERQQLEAELARQREAAVDAGELNAAAAPTTEEQWIAAIGRDSYEASEALIACQHQRARLLAQAGGTSDNPDHRLGGKWVEALVALDRQDGVETARLYEELTIIDDDVDTVQQASIAADQALLEVRRIRREDGVNCKK